MAKHGSKAAAKRPEVVVVSKGKVTPVQVAFIVDRYLADNNYTNTLAAFRSEAGDLFSKTKAKELPRRLLGLGEMLDEYITLKEQRVMLDQERRRAETALHGMQEVMRAYFSAGSASLPPSSPQYAAGTATTVTPAPVLPPFRPNSGSPPGQTVNGISITNFAQPPIVFPVKSADPTNFSTPIPDSSSSKKRKTVKSSLDAPLAPKKTRRQSYPESSNGGGWELSSLESPITEAEKNINIPVTEPALSSLATTASAVQGSVAKSLFKQQSDYQAKSSPKTHLKVGKCSDSPIENPSSETNDASSSKNVASMNCSITASKTVIISPLKQAGYYAIEKSYHITSPYKSKREHVRGKLDFDDPDAQTRLNELVTAGSSTSTSVEMSESFDFDLPDLDIFNGDFSFSELLADIDLDCEPSSQLPSVLASQSPSVLTSSISGYKHNEGSGGPGTNQVVTDSSQLTVLKVLSEKDMKIQGPDSVTSMKTITKRVKFASPVKSS